MTEPAFQGEEPGAHPAPPPHPKHGPAEAVYLYKGAEGQPLFYVCRYTLGDGKKTFLQGHYKGAGKWVWNLRGIEPVLYRLPAVRAHLARNEEHSPLYIVEGEKAVEYLRRYLTQHSLPGEATCNPMGAGKWRESYTEELTGARYVVVVADNDGPGRAGARKVAAELGPVVGRLELMQPAVATEHAGVDDHLAAGLPLEELVPLELEAPASEAQPPEDGPVFVDLRKIEARDAVWLDRPFLPFGELVTNNADGDTGKGLFAVHHAARVSRGEFGERRMVLFVVAEDAFDTVLKPRLLAAGANLECVRALYWRREGFPDPMRVPDDVPALRQHIEELGVRMIVIDPLLSHLTRQTNSHIDQEVRLALQPLIGLAQEQGPLILANGNFSKDKSRGARAAAAASTAFVNVPRVALAMAPDDEDPDLRIVEVIKSNVGPKNVGRNYRVRAVAVEGLVEPVPLLVAEGPATKAVDDLIANQPKGKRIRGELVQALILAELEAGEQPRTYLDEVAAEKLGANPDTVYKAGLAPLKSAGRIKPRKDGMNGSWLWRLSLEEQPQEGAAADLELGPEQETDVDGDIPW